MRSVRKTRPVGEGQNEMRFRGREKKTEDKSRKWRRPRRLAEIQNQMKPQEHVVPGSEGSGYQAPLQRRLRCGGRLGKKKINK